MSGLTPCHASYGVWPASARVTQRLRRWTAVSSTSDHKYFGSRAPCSIARTSLSRVRLSRSATPFCCEVYAAERCSSLPRYIRKARCSLFVYSPPPSLRRRNTR